MKSPIDEEVLYREAVLKSPQRASRLERVLTEQRQLVGDLDDVDPDDQASLAILARNLRDRQREEASLLAEIWYEELGGEG